MDSILTYKKIQANRMDTKKKNPSFYCIQENHLNFKDWHYLNVNGCKKMFQTNEPKKQAGIAILIYNRIVFKLKLIKRDPEDVTY